ncbi:HNH endonuclease [Mesorhizobium sp. CA8]|uniref:HNH endonuclease n=1 Tax=Mesorhizobium sp. CA8 TaxID=2876637 RepID=UPI001CCC603F|nr:HNH endonuclease [Mesorhizobium sp. CA8]MBZ9760660.1 HNH endonuclease [Mesorhizobium sp. CA8]
MMQTPLEMRNLAAGQGNEVSDVQNIPSSKEHQPSEKRLTPQARWQARNPLKRWCHTATASAMKRGILVRQPCQNCGAEKTDAHHRDHRFPLSCEFLCRRCHKAEERRLRREVAE